MLPPEPAHSHCDSARDISVKARVCPPPEPQTVARRDKDFEPQPLVPSQAWKDRKQQRFVRKVDDLSSILEKKRVLLPWISHNQTGLAPFG